MSKIVNNDKLTFILTSYGLDRVAEALSNPTVNLYISKIKLGSGNNYEYYTPDSSQTNLKGPISGYEFPIADKDLLEDNLTISFHAVIPEGFGGYDIREVGLYETIDGVDYLFALSTQQPLVKPAQADQYLISIDYYIFLKSQNFADVYDSIVLDPENQLVTKENLEDLMSTILFAQSNLIDQIGHNSDIIGLNRASQLYDKIVEERRNFSYTITYNNYADLIDIASIENVYSYWVFNYPRRSVAINSITDISKNGYNLSSDQAINLYDRKYYGFLPMLKFGGSHYYYLSSDSELSFLTEDKTADIDFTLVFAVDPIGFTAARTLLARSNYATGTNVFEIQELTNNRLMVRLFADSNNYITFTTGIDSIPTDEHSLVISYTAESHDLIVYINGKSIPVTKVTTGTYQHMNSSLTTLYAYAATPIEVKYANSSTAPTILYNSDGTPNTDSKWTTSSNEVFYENTSTTYDSSRNVTLPIMYAWEYADTETTYTIYTKDSTLTATSKLYNADYTEYTGSDFEIVLSGTTYVIQYLGHDTTAGTNIPAKTIYAFVYTITTQYIWANSNTNPTVLYNFNGNLYTGTDWIITNNVVKYKTYTASYASAYNITVPALEATSYVIDVNGNKSQYINSYIGVASIIKSSLTGDQLREVSLLLQASLGKNPCVDLC